MDRVVLTASYDLVREYILHGLEQTFGFADSGNLRWNVHCKLDEDLVSRLNHKYMSRVEFSYEPGNMDTVSVALTHGFHSYSLDVLWVDRTERTLFESKKMKIDNLRNRISEMTKDFTEQLNKLVEECDHPASSVSEVPGYVQASPCSRCACRD